MIPNAPIYRISFYLAKILGDDVETPTPIYREEFYLAKILGDDVELPYPVSRLDYYLAKIAGMDVEIPTPRHRAEYYLAKIAGEDVFQPTPISRLDYYLAQWAATPQGEAVTITGVSPLLLAAALEKEITALIQSGKVEQDGTPTPVAPVPIVCNNGTLAFIDDELPTGYTRLQYIESNGTDGYVDTGIILNSLDLDVEIDFQLTDTYAPSPRMEWGFMGTPSSLPRWGFGAYSSKWLGSPNATASAGELDTDRHVAVMRVYVNSSDVAMYSGTLDGEALYNANNLGNISLFEGNDKWSVYLFARNNNNTAGNFVPCKIFRFKVYKAGALTHDLVPCKNGNGVLGFYDLMTATFSGASGTLIAGAADYSHAHIGADGTPEALSVGGKNLNGGTIDHKGYTSTGGESTSTTFAGTLWQIPCEAGQKFTVSWGGFPDGVSGVFINTWKTDGTWNTRQAISASTSLTYTIGAGISIVNFTLYKTGGVTIGDNAWIQVEYGDTATDYQPYREPQTATVPNLYAVGNYADFAEIIGGMVNRKVGIKVFDGTETIGTSNACFTIGINDRMTTKTALLCSHFPYSSKTSSQTEDETIISFSSSNIGFRYDACADKTAFAAWLKGQYDAGTPVIVIYPLAEEAQESISPQPLSTADGDNVVTVTANVDNIQLETTYAKKKGA